ncbi:ATP-binding protein [Actinokineospora iranica]|uniref:Transcriptional regulator, LuxR family n=1 Tax=Actinokineospora iranica TaxID=1271860 RepID=A0A1G6LER7_9PSEU|nr:LuxR C-terminal-related transcriptional regulator [Actinokineospora iranica]SDC41265.1 transcriptional regulator, LuxR family [Actinokineospora iranica]
MSDPAAARALSTTLSTEMTSYVGRAAEISEVKRLLGVSALVTVTGPGGVGKTRLAAQVAAAARAAFDDNVVCVGLAELREPELVVNTVADHLGLGDRSRSPIELVIEHLRERRMLLVLDNCEHLIEPCARLAHALLSSCPELVVLATSRQSLGVAGERVRPLAPLAVPEPGEQAAGVERHDSVRLFLDRATAVVPSFTITRNNVEDVIRLCRALDGLPLAIELAAVRLRSLSVRQLADRLDQRFTLLNRGRRWAPSRHETLRALVDWSHELCDGREQLLWARASVFSGSFDMDAAEEVCSGDGLDRDAVLDVIDALIDKSVLVREEHHGTARYRMLGTLRQHGEDRLRETGELTRTQRRHRDRYLELTRRFAAESLGPDQVRWLDRLTVEHPNLRRALDFCARDPAEAAVGLPMIPAVKEYWMVRGLNTEGRIWLDRLVKAAPVDAPGRADALWMHALLALVQGDRPAFAATLAAAAQTADATGDVRARAYVHHVSGYEALMDADGPAAVDRFGTAAEMLRAHGDLGGELWATHNLGLAISIAGDPERCRRVLRDCVAACVARGEVVHRSWALWSLAACEYLFGDIETAQAHALEVLRLQQRFDARTITAFTLATLAGCATHAGDLRRAARLFGAAAALWRSLGSSPSNYPAFDEPVRAATAVVVAGLGDGEALAEFAAGAALGFADAVSYALGESAEENEHMVAPRDDPLTKRERQIAELVAQGMTNREIAGRLVIGPRTAESHVERIRTKLGFTNRAQIAAWVAHRGSKR